MDENSQVFVISIAAELAGMHPQTLRQYDRLGLVSPSRTAGKSRRYSMRDVAKLQEIARLGARGRQPRGHPPHPRARGPGAALTEPRAASWRRRSPTSCSTGPAVACSRPARRARSSRCAPERGCGAATRSSSGARSSATDSSRTHCARCGRVWQGDLPRSTPTGTSRACGAASALRQHLGALDPHGLQLARVEAEQAQDGRRDLRGLDRRRSRSRRSSVARRRRPRSARPGRRLRRRRARRSSPCRRCRRRRVCTMPKMSGTRGVARRACRSSWATSLPGVDRGQPGRGDRAWRRR